MANRLSHFLNIKGPSVTLDTACSSSMVGLHLAVRALHNGESDAAIVATSNIYLNPEHVQDVGSLGQAHSPTGLCHTFDASADGYIKSEAVSAIILKRLGDAIQDGDPIRAVIRGTASTRCVLRLLPLFSSETTAHPISLPVATDGRTASQARVPRHRQLRFDRRTPAQASPTSATRHTSSATARARLRAIPPR